METPVLLIENLSISFFAGIGEIPAVTNFSCRIMPGEALGLVGESGCGKSTVALAIMRYLGRGGRITGGTIRFDGRELTTMSEPDLRRLRGSELAMIYQEPMASLNPAMTVGKQLMEVPMTHGGLGADAARTRALEVIAAVKLPDPARVLQSYPHQLSGGQQQRVVIAMALMSRPKLLILDEPTTALDVTVEAGIVALIKELRETSGTSLLFISHNLGLVLETCDQVCVMYSGEAVETGAVATVFSRTRHPYTEALFRAIPLPGADKTERPLKAIPGHLPLPYERPPGCNFGPRCGYFIAGRCDGQPVPMLDAEPAHASRCLRLGEIPWGEEHAKAEQREPFAIGDPVLKVVSLRKYYASAANAIFGGGETRTVKANESLNFNAREAEILAIVGESGCGKSTLAKILVGLETASGGTVTLGNQPIESTLVQARPRETVAAIQMVFQNPFDTLNPSMTIGRQIIRALEKFDIGANDRDRRNRMLELLDLVRLPRAFEKRRPHQLSGGQKQRIGIARAFAGRPKLVIADEPVSALDVSVQAAVTELLMDVQREARTTMLFISHDLSVVRYLADRVVVMYLGHIVEQGSTQDVFAPPYHPYTEALLSAVPIADPKIEKRQIVLSGEIPSALSPPSGCPFHTRCRWKQRVPDNRCENELPAAAEVKQGHAIRCHLAAVDFAEMEPVISSGD
ncbi:ABC transporter ATP-binding protein [Dongia sedimenti]|uniref:ABC transporter ATP-binding protein n=1 Tax=Dongia sedimenti TaxID=3064282 RepID=A0ABU0YTB5_9PROT|nr:ABC transporter ATP-binding protein [Rhodospirillaceae bacterium R-7]